MSSNRLLLTAAAALIPALVFAQDVIILVTGQNLKGKMLRFDDNRFTMMVGTEVREIAVEDIHSIFFAIDEAASPTVPATNSAATVAPPAETSAPPASATATPPVATSGIPPGPYGPVEKNVSVGEYLLHGPSVTGKVVKVEFFYRSPIQAGKSEAYKASIHDKEARLDIEFGKDAYDWFKQLPDHIVYTDINWRKARAYYMYGVVGQDQIKASLNGLPTDAQKLYPIGRKTKKGMRGALEYGW